MKKLIAALAAGLVAFNAFAWPALPASADTTNLAVTASAQNITVPGIATGSALKQIIVTVDGTQTVFFRCDGTTATTGNAQPGLAKTQFVISLTVSIAACSVISGNTGSTIYFTLVNGE